MKIRLYKFTFAELFFMLGAFLLTANILTYQALELAAYKNVLRIIGISCFLMVLLLNFYTIKLEFCLCLIFLYSIFQFVHSNENALNVISIIILLFAARTISYENIKKIFLIVAWLSLFVWFGLLIFGKISITPWDTMRYRALAGTSLPRIRYSLGFLYEINLGSWYINSAILLIMLCGGVKRGKIVFVSILTLLIYIITDSRTTLLFYLFFLLVYFFEIKIKIYKRFHSFLFYLVLLCFSTLPFMAKYLLTTIPVLDRWLSGRLYLISDAMEGMSILNILFGTYGVSKSCFYYLLLAQCGIFVYICFLCFIAKKIDNYYRHGCYVEFAFLFACMFVGLSEGTIFSIEEITSLYFWSLISVRKGQLDEESSLLWGRRSRLKVY